MYSKKRSLKFLCILRDVVHEHTTNKETTPCIKVVTFKTGLEIATDTVANATNIFSLATKNSSLVAKVATRFLYDLDLN